jgi:hypothetical protein
MKGCNTPLGIYTIDVSPEFLTPKKDKYLALGPSERK